MAFGEPKYITKKMQFEAILNTLSKTYPFLLGKIDVAKILGISRVTLDRKISKGQIKLVDNKISLSSVAKYLCGE